jgi:hypothetical protein
MTSIPGFSPLRGKRSCLRTRKTAALIYAKHDKSRSDETETASGVLFSLVSSLQGLCVDHTKQRQRLPSENGHSRSKERAWLSGVRCLASCLKPALAFDRFLQL